MFTKNDLAKLASGRGWDYVLTKVDPNNVDDAALGELLMDTQDLFRSLRAAIVLEEPYDPFYENDELNFDDV